MQSRVRELVGRASRFLASFFTTRMLLASALVVFFFAAFQVTPALAQPAVGAGGNDIAKNIATAISDLMSLLIKTGGRLLLLLTDVLLIRIAQYNGFVTATVVVKGWVIVRDLTNMFFVLMMLIISIGTILGSEEFSYRKLLPRLLIMAVVINFSKVIVGVFIDFSQVIMLTFVNGFVAAAGGNIVKLFQLKEAMEITEKFPVGQNGLQIYDLVGSQILAFIMIMISGFCVLVMSMMLAFRIVMLWILTILSPLAFFLSAFPKGRAASVYGEWWKKFGDNLTAGPVLAFFLWLAFAVTASTDFNKELSVGTAVVESAPFFPTEAGSEGSMTSFVIGVSLLLGGMYITADFGVAGGNALRSGADYAKGLAQKAARLPLRAALGIGGAAVGGAVAGGKLAAGFGEQKLYAGTGIALAPSRYTKAFKDWREDVAKKDETAGLGIAAGRAARGGRLAPLASLMGSPKDFFQDYMSAKGVGLAGSQMLRGWDNVDDKKKRAQELRGRAQITRDQASGVEAELNETKDMGAAQVMGLRADASKIRGFTGADQVMTDSFREMLTKQRDAFREEAAKLNSDALAETDPAEQAQILARANNAGGLADVTDRALLTPNDGSVDWSGEMSGVRATLNDRATDAEL